jgi:hypothetical protein
MSRVTPAEVTSIVATSLSDSVVQLWIDAASAIVDTHADCIGGTEALLTQVELYLSAHMVAMLSADTRGFISEEGPAGFTTKYSNPVKMQGIIESTPFGMTANMLSNGCLANVSQQLATVDFF